MALRKYDKEWLEELCAESTSYAQVLQKAGRAKGGGAQATLKAKIQEYGIDVSHFRGQAWNKGKTAQTDSRIKSRAKYQVEDIFIKNCPVQRKMLREYILRDNLIEYKCQKCGCDGKWQDGEIALELHHIDGDSTNGELSNLCFLCPNCHALTDSYRGRNKQQ